MEPRVRTSSGPLTRRSLLGALGGAAVLAACSSSSSSSGRDTLTTVSSTLDATPRSVATTSPNTSPADLTATPTETGGPFPADGSNDNGAGAVADVLSDPRSVRSDIRADLDGTNVQDGAPLDLVVKVRDGRSGGALTGAAVYVWHCNRDGQYSACDSAMLGGDFSPRSFLRGVQVTDDDGLARFTTILPGRYQGRAFHIHFEVYADASYGTKLLTSQMAVDDDLIDSLYGQATGYESARRNDTDNARDNVFGDGVQHQLLDMSGDVDTGLRASFTAVV